SEFEATAERGIAVRSFDTRHAFGSYRNSDGLSLVVRYPLPVDCSGRSDQDLLLSASCPLRALRRAVPATATPAWDRRPGSTPPSAPPSAGSRAPAVRGRRQRADRRPP